MRKEKSLTSWLVATSVALLTALAGPMAAAPNDADDDGWDNALETALGSLLDDPASTPEHMAVQPSERFPEIPIPDTCCDGVDNDGDGLTDAADPGCAMPPLVSAAAGDLSRPGIDAFPSSAVIDGHRLAGPVVLERGALSDGRIPLTMVAMQLRDAEGVLTVIEDPEVDSTGWVVLGKGEPFPATSRLEVATVILVEGDPVDHRTDEIENGEIFCLPPVFPDCHDLVPQQFCYKNPNAAIQHCPEWPEKTCGKERPRPINQWVAKFDCGVQPSTPPPFLGPVKPGNYATKIVIHNPLGWPVELQKKVSVGERNPKWGPISNIQTLTLPPDATTEIDCPDVFQLLGQPLPPPGQPIPFMNGVAVILSEDKLDVIGNYTYELAKEKIEFYLYPPKNAPEALRRLKGKRLKLLTLTLQEVVIDVEEEVREALRRQFPAQVVAATRIKIVGDDIGVGSSLDVEHVEPQRCIYVDPPTPPHWRVWCEVEP